MSDDTCKTQREVEDFFKRCGIMAKDGSVDFSKIPIENNLKRVIEENKKFDIKDESNKLHDAIRSLSCFYRYGREEAGIFLMGFLVYSDDNWEKRKEIVEALSGFNNKSCANLLYSELKRVKSSNRTRTYINTILKVLSEMPEEIVVPIFESLAEDKNFTYKMRKRFQEIVMRKTDFHPEELADALSYITY